MSYATLQNLIDRLADAIVTGGFACALLNHEPPKPEPQLHVL